LVTVDFPEEAATLAVSAEQRALQPNRLQMMSVSGATVTFNYHPFGEAIGGWGSSMG
jgi:hypothetical protein